MRLEINCVWRYGILIEILHILDDHKVEVLGIEAWENPRLYLNLEEVEFDLFQTLMATIRKHPDILDVFTIPFMPIEQQKEEISTVLNALPEPLFSLSPKGIVLQANNTARNLPGIDDKLIGSQIKNLISGFNISQWLQSKNPGQLTTRLQFCGETTVAMLTPVYIDDENGGQVFASAVLMLQSLSGLSRQISAAQASIDEFDYIQANNSAMKQILRQAKKASGLDIPVLLVGETGTGKSMLARAMHEQSNRRDRPFVWINCSSLPEEATEQELFGSREFGPGLVEKAMGGTLFFHDIGDASPTLQGKLLRLLDEGRFNTVGGDKDKMANVRMMFATQKNLPKLTEQGKFRDDLFHRISALTLHIPPLRDRRDDVLPLVSRFARKFADEGTKVQIPEDVRQLIKRYSWPGNIRQLENSIKKAVAISENGTLTARDLQIPDGSDQWGYADTEFEGTLDQATRQFEEQLLRRLYPAYPSSRLLGKKLGVSHTAIANKLRDYKIGKTRK